MGLHGAPHLLRRGGPGGGVGGRVSLGTKGHGRRCWKGAPALFPSSATATPGRQKWGRKPAANRGCDPRGKGARRGRAGGQDGAGVRPEPFLGGARAGGARTTEQAWDASRATGRAGPRAHRVLAAGSGASRDPAVPDAQLWGALAHLPSRAPRSGCSPARDGAGSHPAGGSAGRRRLWVESSGTSVGKSGLSGDECVFSG